MNFYDINNSQQTKCIKVISTIHAQTENNNIQISFLLHKKVSSNELTTRQ